MAAYFEDLVVGHPYFGSELIADQQEMLEYGRRFDPWPMHADPDIGDASPLGGLVASGGYTISLWYLSAHSYLRAPGREWMFLGGFDWHVKFAQPLRPGDRVRVRSVVTEKRLSSKPGRGTVNTQTDLIDHQDEPVLLVSAAIMMATRPGPSGSKPENEE